MMRKRIEELAELYGIEINNVESGKGGLFYKDTEGTKIALKDIFDSYDYTTPRLESVSLKKCNTYSSYSEISSLMLNAA